MWKSQGDPCEAIRLVASVSLDGTCASLDPSLSYQWFDAGTGASVESKAESPMLGTKDEFEGKSLYCVVTSDSASFYGSI